MVASRIVSLRRCALGKELIDLQDKVYDFEKKRNTIRKYDRETMLKTIRAMKRISEIKRNREQVPFELVCILQYGIGVARCSLFWNLPAFFSLFLLRDILSIALFSIRCMMN